MGSGEFFFRLTIATMSLGIVSGCSQKNILDCEIKAGTVDEFAACQANLVSEHTPRLARDFDTAIQELKLDSITKGVLGVEMREERMRATANGKSVKEVLVLGWQARRARLVGELKGMNERYAHDVKLLSRHGSSDSTQFLSNTTQNEENSIALLKTLLGDADQRLTEWGASPAQIAGSEQTPPSKTTVVAIPDSAGSP